MPIFSYKCYECKHEFDVLCKYEERVQTCPECDDHTSTKRQVSAPRGRVAKGVYDEFL